jgi:hypothetical protein
MLKDRRKPWQKTCINFSWSRCGTMSTPLAQNHRQKRVKAFLEADNHQTKFTWYDDAARDAWREEALKEIAAH